MDQTHKCWRHQLSEKKFHRSIIQMEMSPKPPKQIYCPKMVPTAIVKPGEHTHWQPWLSTYILPFFYFRQYLGHIPTHFYMSGINSLWASVKLKQACTTEPVPTFIAAYYQAGCGSQAAGKDVIVSLHRTVPLITFHWISRASASLYHSD